MWATSFSGNSYCWTQAYKVHPQFLDLTPMSVFPNNEHDE